MDTRQHSRILESQGYGIPARETLQVGSSYSTKVEFTEKDLSLIFDQLSAKGTRLFTTFANNKQVLTLFKKKHLHENTYAKIGARKILYDLANQRKIGVGLKGLSKSVLSEIEHKMWDILELQIKLFYKDQEIIKYSELLTQDPLEMFKVPA